MSTTFLEPGGDATFDIATTNGFWSSADATIATDFVHGTHIKSIKVNNTTAFSKTGVCADAGTRISLYVYIATLPSSTQPLFYAANASSTGVVVVAVTTGGVLRLLRGVGDTQIGTDGATLSTATWYRISLAFTISSTTINRFELFKDGVSTISVTNATLARTGSSILALDGNSATSSLRFDDIYVDNSSALTDPGDIWVTAKRPFSNGTLNNFSTQIGAGGSGYGTGHSSQVNERPLDVANGWSIIGAGSAVTEEYNIENATTGDMNMGGNTIVDYMGWFSTKALVGETVQMVLNGVSIAQAITSTNTMYTKAAGSTTYPAGTGADIGEITDTSLTTVSLYECGIMIAFLGTPIPAPTSTAHNLTLMGVGK